MTIPPPPHPDAIHNHELLQIAKECNHTITDYKTLCTAGIFATYPKSFLTLGTGFFDQVSPATVFLAALLFYVHGVLNYVRFVFKETVKGRLGKWSKTELDVGWVADVWSMGCVYICTSKIIPYFALFFC